MFRILPPEQESGSESFDRRYIGYFVRFLKVVAYVFCFVVVLGGAVVSKGTTLFMTSHIKPNRAIRHCNEDIERDHQYQAEISSTERVAWVWCLFFAFIAPEVGTLFRSTRMSIFKSIKRCTIGDFCLVLFFESMHTIGLALFVFIVLPQLDVVKGAMITNCVSFLPAVFGKFYCLMCGHFFLPHNCATFRERKKI